VRTDARLARALGLAEALEAGAAALAGATPTPRLDAEVLLQHASGATRARLLAHPEEMLPEPVRDAYAAMIERRRRGEPVAYITGRREFWSLDLVVSPATLIPRPETELLVERALARIPLAAVGWVADLGTGSGAVALALGAERAALSILATDRSAAALAVARANAARLGITNVRFCVADWCDALAEGRFEAIVSNPPYVRTNDPHLEEGDLRFEPHGALVAGPDGLEALRAMAAGAHTRLVSGGWLLLEHGYDQGPAVRALLETHGYRDVRTYSDLSGQERVTEGRRQ